MDKSIAFCIQFNSHEEVIPTEDERNSFLAIGILNCIVALPTTAFNALIIYAIATTPVLQTPSYVLLTSLALTDLLVGMLAQPLQGAMMLYYRSGDLEAYCSSLRSSAAIIGGTAAAASVGTVTAIAVDRYLAIRLKIQYKSIVTVSRVKVVLLLLWGFCILMASLPFVVPLTEMSVLASCLVSVCLITTVILYALAFKGLKRHCAQIKPYNNGSIQAIVDIEKYKKLLKTMFILLVFVVFCYSNMAVTLGLFSNPHYQRSIMWGLMSIVGLNSTFNPVIYTSRMRDLRCTCCKIVRKHFKCNRRRQKIFPTPAKDYREKGPHHPFACW